MGRNGLTRYMSARERFVNSYIEMDSGCWIWVRSVSAGRYGSFMVDGKTVRAHRWSYEQANGSIPEGLEVDHMCGQTLCVRPLHLRALTSSENVRAHWREQRGVCRNGHDMTDESNVVWRLRGTRRQCRTCERAKQARYRASQKVA